MQKNRGILFLNLSGMVLFCTMLYNVLFHGPMLLVDKWVSMHISEVHTEIWTKMIIFVTDLNGMIASTILFIGFTLFFWYKKYYRDLWFFFSSFAGAAVLFNLFKFTLQRPRPDAKLFDLVTYSFPSGHTTMATVLALSLYFIFREKVGESLRVLLLFASIFWPVTIAFTRVYLNVHWVSDVLAGLGLGLFWVTLLYMFYPSGKKKVVKYGTSSYLEQ
jgi:undecaprenyl-diphosphatase